MTIFYIGHQWHVICFLRKGNGGGFKA